MKLLELLSSPTMELDRHFDAHCHLFDLSYLMREAGHILHDLIAGDYPHQAPPEGVDFPDGPRSYAYHLLKWLGQIRAAARGPEADNLAMVLDACAKAHGDGMPVSAVPLMMDIYFMFAPPVQAGERAPVRKRKRYRFQEWLAATDRKLDAKIAAGMRRHSVKESVIDRLVNELKPRFMDSVVHALLTLFIKPTPYFDSRGFRHHREALQALVGKRKGELYPFLAVDPRRTGLIDTIRKGKLVGKSGPFYGVKLYPRLGYHPQCADLWDLYAWCAEHSIPIVTHTDAIGFPPPELESLLQLGNGHFGDPVNFEPVLKKHPNLFIDFAHFGMSDPKWADTIARLMGEYQNVYSDLACYTVPAELERFRKDVWERKEVATRTMFGTDFDVMYFTTPGITLETYYANACKSGLFTPAELAWMSCHAPKRFLGLEDK